MSSRGNGVIAPCSEHLSHCRHVVWSLQSGDSGATSQLCGVCSSVHSAVVTSSFAAYWELSTTAASFVHPDELKTSATVAVWCPQANIVHQFCVHRVFHVDVRPVQTTLRPAGMQNWASVGPVLFFLLANRCGPALAQCFVGSWPHVGPMILPNHVGPTYSQH